MKIAIPLLVLVLSCAVYGQTDFLAAESSGNCERTSAHIDSFVQSVPKGEPVTIISYMGRSDSKAWNKAASRLGNARKYLTGAYYQESDSYRTNEQIIGAIADTVRDRATLEFYNAGKLLLVIEFGKNSSLHVSCALDMGQP